MPRARRMWRRRPDVYERSPTPPFPGVIRYPEGPVLVRLRRGHSGYGLRLLRARENQYPCARTGIWGARLIGREDCLPARLLRRRYPTVSREWLDGHRRGDL